MNTTGKKSSVRAFTVIELMLVVLTLGILLLILLPALAPAHNKQQSIQINCVNNLKQIGLSFRIWSGDNRDRYTMRVPTNEGGTMEFAGTAGMFHHFQSMSNELNTPKVVVCPDDKQRSAATNFLNDFNTGHVSYFVGLDTDETQPSMWLAGDRNLTNGLPLKDGLMLLTTNQAVSWTKPIHNFHGNITLADGSVQQTTTAGMMELLRKTGTNVNRLQFP